MSVCKWHEKWALNQIAPLSPQCQLGPPWETKNHHFLKRVSRAPLWDTKNYQLLKRASWSPTSDRKSQHFLMVEIKRKILDLSISAEIDWSKFVPRCFNLPVLRSSQKFEQQYPIRGEHWTRKARRENTPKCSHLNCILTPRTHPRPRRPYRPCDHDDDLGRTQELHSGSFLLQSAGETSFLAFCAKEKMSKENNFTTCQISWVWEIKSDEHHLCGKDFGLKTSWYVIGDTSRFTLLCRIYADKNYK